VAEVRVGVLRADLGPGREQPPVDLGGDGVRIERPGEAGPAGARIVLVERREQRLARDYVDVDAGLVVVPVLVVERSLGAFALRHVVLQRREARRELFVGGLLVVHESISFGLCMRGACQPHPDRE